MGKFPVLHASPQSEGRRDFRYSCLIVVSVRDKHDDFSVFLLFDFSLFLLIVL